MSVNVKQRPDTLVKNVKIPPHSVEAEQSVIGGLMLDNLAWDKVSERVSARDFYRPEHGIIYEVMQRLAENSTPLDVITLSDALEVDEKLSSIGGLAYLTELAQNTPSAANILAYANIVRERSVLRQLLGVSTKIADNVYFPEGRESQEILDDAERNVFAISEHQARGEGPTAVKNVVSGVVDSLDELMHAEGGVTGLGTGFKDLDKMTSGLQKSDLIIVAGRPSMGKTVLGVNIAENAAMDAELPVLIFSMEMPKEAIVMRLLSSLSRVDQAALRSGQLDDADWSRIFSSMSLITDKMNLFIDDTAALSPSEIRSRARRLAREHGGLSLIVVDYLQLMQVPGYKENRTNEVSEISRNLKALAKEINVPVVALSQLSRKTDERNDKRPMMSDLRESGAIEQDADVIMFIYRDEVYNPETEFKGTGEIIISKQRNGPIGMVRLTFRGNHVRFDDYAATRV